MPRRALKRNSNRELDLLKKDYEDAIYAGMADAIWYAAFTTYAANTMGTCRDCGEHVVLAPAADPDEQRALRELGIPDGASEWLNSEGHAICGIEGDDVLLHVRDPYSSLDLHDSLNDPPHAAYTAAKDLARLYTGAVELGLFDYYELAMFADKGEAYELDDYAAAFRGRDEKAGRAIRKEFVDSPYFFGRALARQAMHSMAGDTHTWAHHHKLKSRSAEVEMPSVSFTVVYDGDHLTWDGEVGHASSGGRAVRGRELRDGKPWLLVRRNRSDHDVTIVPYRDTGNPDADFAEALERNFDWGRPGPDDIVEYVYGYGDNPQAVLEDVKSYAWVRLRQRGEV